MTLPASPRCDRCRHWLAPENLDALSTTIESVCVEFNVRPCGAARHLYMSHRLEFGDGKGLGETTAITVDGEDWLAAYLTAPHHFCAMFEALNPGKESRT